MSRERFEPMYESRPPWDTGRPQPEFVRLEESGAVRGSVLDLGCGTGENALFLASRGHEVWGLDVVPVAIEQAAEKARERGLVVTFLVGDALDPAGTRRSFDNVIDSGLFHTFDDDPRARYVTALGQFVRPGGMLFILCFSDDEPPGEGPRRVTREEIEDAFRDDWSVRDVRATRFEVVTGPGAPTFSEGGPRAWLASIERTTPTR